MVKFHHAWLNSNVKLEIQT